jgi:hypothetical protein
LKLENLQHTGAFKYRGAMNAILTLDEAHKKADANRRLRRQPCPRPRETEIELMVETRGYGVVESLLPAISARGYQAQMFTFE